MVDDNEEKQNRNLTKKKSNISCGLLVNEFWAKTKKKQTKKL